MTTKDYEAIASVLADAYARSEAAPAHMAWEGSARSTVEAIAVDLADKFQASDPKFNRVRFLHAALHNWNEGRREG